MSIVIPCTSVLPGYFPLPAHAERDDIIEHFFHLGLGYSEILMCLFLLDGICLSIRQLKRILRCRGLGRRANRDLKQPGRVCGRRREKTSEVWVENVVQSGKNKCLRWLNTVLRAVSGNSRDGKLRQTNMAPKKQWYTEDDFSKSTH